MPAETHRIIDCRVERGNRAAIVFVHGGGGDPIHSWGRFPEFLALDRRAKGWDIYSYGYVSTGPHKVLRLGIARLIKYLLRITADPLVPALAGGLATALNVEPLKRYDAFAIIAHSFGGLIAQRMLVYNKELASRVRFLFLFGVPSNGFSGWRLDYLMEQIRSIRPGSALILDLRRRWKEMEDKGLPFEYWAFFGDQDAFVEDLSEHGVFPSTRCYNVPGDHESMKEPEDAQDMPVQLVLEKLSGQALHADRWGSARAAVELGQYQRAIDQYQPNVDELDEDGLVQLALALDSVGRNEQALQALARVRPEQTDALGVLAGRLKRRWLLKRSEIDAQKALGYYCEAYRRAAAEGRHDQAYYHGINVAFMQLAYSKDRKAAAETARQVVEHCKHCPPGYWRFATEGEARLCLGDFDAAFACYEKALAEPGTLLRQKHSTHQQAAEVARLLQQPNLVSRVDALFFPAEAAG